MEHLLAKIWADPFEYAIGAVMVVLAISLVVRTFKDTVLDLFD